MKKLTTRTFVYKRAEGFAKTSFDDLLRLAVKSQDSIAKRKFDPDNHGETFHLINDYTDQAPEFFAGILCFYTPGRHQPVFSLDDDAKTIQLETIEPQKITKRGRELTQEFLDGCMYFLAKENHLILSPSMSFRPDKAENYFNWFFREKAKLFEEPFIIYLQDQLPPDKLQKIENVKNLLIGDSIVLNPKQNSTPNTKVIKATPGGAIWGALKELLPSLPDEFSITKALGEYVIDAKILLKVGRKGRDAEDFVSRVATSMRNVEGIDCTIDMGKFGKIKGKEFKLTRTWQFEQINGKLDQLVIFKKMNEWLDELIKTKRVFTKV